VPVDADLPLAPRLAWAGLFALEHLTPPGGAAAARLARARRGLLRRLDATALRPPLRAAVDEGALEPAEFLRRYVDRPAPFVFRGAAKGWRCCREWSLEALAARFGEEPVRLLGLEGLRYGAPDASDETITLAELARRIAAGGADYLRFAPIERSELRADLDLDWLAARRGAREHPGPLQFFIGGRGTRTPLHAETPGNFYVQVEGRKRWWLYPPGSLLFLDPPAARMQHFHTEGDPAAPDPSTHPLLAAADRYETVLEPGDVLWFPPFWWHDVKNLSEATVAVGYRTCSIASAVRSSPLLAAMRCLALHPHIGQSVLHALAGRYSMYTVVDARAAGREEAPSAR
jgi:hypothetical protein